MSASSTTPIAIIGIGCRFPGGVDNSAGLWTLAAQGRSTVGPVPVSRWDAARLAEFHDPDVAIRANRGCFLDGDVWAWEPEAFSVAPIERDWVDPQTRVMLEVAWEAVEHAGIPLDRVRGSRTGVYVGTYAPDNLFRDARPVEDAPNSAYLFGNYAAGTAGRVAFALDLRGPVMVISTHCSSGLVAVDTACGALVLGECDMAVAGGVLLILAPQTHCLEAPLLLSKRGACHAFDARADGYVRGEGAGALVLKRLADARRDGDRVLAVIRGSAVNNDGQASRLTAPSSRMQQRLFRDAVRRADIDPGQVGLVEAHGPGTGVGDPIEYNSINAVYGRGQGRCALGSIKTNIGHSEPVSGVAGLIKVVESLRRGHIPPNINFRDWNPQIVRDDRSRLFVPTELTPWPVAGDRRLAAVCSYGVTGTNAHMVLESAPSDPRRGQVGSATVPRHTARLFLFSGNGPTAVTATAARFAGWADGDGASADPADVAHTLAVRRDHGDHRLAIVARDLSELAARARDVALDAAGEGVVTGTPVVRPDDPGPVFVFTGQGSQRPGMGLELLTDEPVFAEAIDELEPLIRAESGFSLREMIMHPGGLVGVDRIQPTLFGIQVALAAVWRSWGVEPAAVIGQSLGEVAAAVVARILSPAEGAAVICRRATLLARIAHGAMASVMLSAADTQAAIEAAAADGVSIGVRTAPNTTVISGDARQVRALVDGWTATGIVARMVDVDVASHSAQVDPILTELRSVLSGLPPHRPQRIVLFSTVSDDPRDPGPLDAGYWIRNQRDTVQFQRAVTAALTDGHRLFIECTPHPLASRPILDIASDAGMRDVVAVGSLRRNVADQEALLTHLATVHCAGYDRVDFASRYGAGDLVDLPTTAWQRVRHGGGTPYRLVAPHLVGATQHPLLGGRVSDPDTPNRHLWQTPIGPRGLPWLADHRVADVPVLPGTGFAEMILSAAARVFDTRRVALRAMSVDRPLPLDPEPVVTTRLVRDGTTGHVEVLTQHADGVTVHAHATARPLLDREIPDPSTDADRPTAAWVDTLPADVYRHFRDQHDIHHGPAFTAVDAIQVHPDEDRAVARLRIADEARMSAWMMALHPALADQLVHVVVAVWLAHHTPSPGPVVVAGVDDILVFGPTAHSRLAKVRLLEADDVTCVADGRLVTTEGTVVAEIRGLRLTNITPPAERFAGRLSHLAWVAEQAREDRVLTTDGSWLVVTDTVADAGGHWPAELALALDRRTAGCTQIPIHDHAPLSVALPAHCAGVVLAVTGRPNDTDPARTAHDHVDRAIGIIGELAALPTPPRLWVVARADRALNGSAVLGLGGLRGLLRSAAYEHPHLTPSMIDCTEDVAWDTVVDELLDGEQPASELSLNAEGRRVARVHTGPPRGMRVAADPESPVRGGASYLVTGALGGLGMCTVRWLAQRGAGRVVVNARSAPTSDAERQLAELRAGGTEITVVQGDVAARGVAARLVEAAVADGRALRGVLHAAGVVEDATLTGITTALLDRVWRGKAAGALALHRATAGQPLDFFVVYSSIAALIGSPGQASYAAANAFVDALVAWRQDTGRPATAVHWGPWSQVGRGQHLADKGFATISPADGIDALERILAAGYHQVAYSPLDIDRWIDPYPALRDSALLRDVIAPPDRRREAPVREALLAAGGAIERRRILEEFLIAGVRRLLGGTTRHIGPHTSMVVLGLDSLGAVQLQQYIRQALKIDVKPGVIWIKPDAASLADWLLDHLGLSTDPATDPAAADATATTGGDTCPEREGPS